MIGLDHNVTLRTRFVRATGQLLFLRRHTLTRIVIPIGTSVAHESGLTFSVIGHTGPTSLDGAPRATWQVDPGVGELFVLACADLSGPWGNLSPGTIRRLLTPVAGVDEVTNPEAFEGGAHYVDVVAVA